MSQFGSIIRAPDEPQPSSSEFVNYVSLGTVGLDPEDPSLAYVRVVNGQVLVEVELAGDGDAVNAYLCHSQTGASAGDYIPVEPGESVVLVWPDGQASSPYIIARLADVERQLAGSCCGLSTVTGGTTVRQFRWLRTPAGQIYAVQSGGEMLLEGSSVRIKGAQVLLDGTVHLGADFATQPVPGAPLDGTETSPSVPAVPFVPPLAPSLATTPTAPQASAGILRFSDAIEANLLTDPEFMAWVAAANVILTAAAGLLALPWPFPNPPTKLTSRANTASKHTATDPVA
jgi:preprotein translocase subunit Sec61beta